MQPGLANGATHLGCIPNCVLENVLLNLLSAEELCKLGVVSRRFAGLTVRSSSAEGPATSSPALEPAACPAPGPLPFVLPLGASRGHRLRARACGGA